MLKKIILTSAGVGIAFTILLLSILRAASVRYTFSHTSTMATAQFNMAGYESVIDYPLIYQGSVLPGDILWPAKAIRDRIWLLVTTNPGRRAELDLLFADKRLVSAKVLFERGEYDLGISTLTKAEKYLEEAWVQEEKNRQNGMNTDEMLARLALASLKHIEMMQVMLVGAPEDVRPIIIRIEDYPKRIYTQVSVIMIERGLPVPVNPFGK